jgi:hypothetical protein
MKPVHIANYHMAVCVTHQQKILKYATEWSLWTNGSSKDFNANGNYF